MSPRTFLVALAASSLVVANIIAAKIIEVSVPFLGELTASAGVVPIAVAFLCTDVLNERYGKDVAQEAVWVSVGVIVISWVMIQMSVWFPHNSGVPQETFATTLSSSTPLFIASVMTVLVSQTFDVVVFDKLRYITGGESRWIRNIGSTSLSQLLDTALFSVLAFMVLPVVVGGTQLSLGVVVSIVVVEYVVKLSLAIADTPLFYALTTENGDHGQVMTHD